MRGITKIIEEYVEGYELRAGSGDYTPTEHEQFLIIDCILGLIEEKEFKAFFVPSLSGVGVREKCSSCEGYGHFTDSEEGGMDVVCGKCPPKDPEHPNYGGCGYIERPAELEDVDIKNNINEINFALDRLEKICSILTLKGDKNRLLDWLHDIKRSLNQVLTTKSGGRLFVKEEKNGR